MNSYVVLDVETTVYSDRTSKANPFDPRNSIYMLGLKEKGKDIVTITGDKMEYILEAMRKGTTLVGHNIKFDIHYLRKHVKGFSEALKDCVIWDTQSAEYILSGQRELYPSLDDCALKYGGTLKDSRVSDMWKDGYNTEDIPVDILTEYLVNDIKNTELVYIKQLELSNNNNQLNIIKCINYSILCTEYMEYNGMYIDKNITNILKDNIKIQLDNIKNKLYTELKHLSSKKILQDNFNFSSPKQLCSLLYGGSITYKQKVPDGHFKTGKRAGEVKFKTVETEVVLDGLVESGSRSVDEKALSGLTHIKLVEYLLQHRKISKDYNTYFKGLDSLRWHYDGCIHHNLNHCSTKTGRLSSTEPNLQNISRGDKSDVKKIFTSRFGSDGVIMVADYSQLEVCTLAHITKDPQLIEDIVSGRDCHLMRASQLYGIPEAKVSKEQRQIAKEFSFQLQYGAGAKSLAASRGVDLSIAKKFITDYYTRYSKVKEYQDNSILEVKRNRKPSEYRTEAGYPAGSGYYDDELGRRYWFREWDTPEFMKRRKQFVGFSPTEIKNLRVQGYATGNIVPIALGKLYNRLKGYSPDEVVLINTVHDSVMLDLRLEVCENIGGEVKETLEGVVDILDSVWGVKFSVPLKVDITTGPSWDNQSKMECL